MASAVVGTLRAILQLDTAEFESASARVSQSAKAFSRDFKTLGAQATTLGSTLTKTITLPLVGLAGGAIKAAMDFESSFANVRKTVEATEPELAHLAMTFRNMATEIPLTTDELNRIAALGGQMGVPIQQLAQFTEHVAALGVAVDGISTEDAAAGLAQIGNISGQGTTQIAEMASALVHLGNSSNATESDILEFTKRLMGSGHAVGMTVSDVMAIGTAMANVGINAEAGGTAMSLMISKMSTAVSTGGAQLKAFDEIVAHTGQNFSQLWSDSPVKAVDAVVQGLSQAQQSGQDLNLVVGAIGATNIRTADTMKRLAGAGTGVADSLAISNDGWQAANKHLDEAEKKYATTANQLKMLWSAVKDVGITLGDAMLPALKSFVGIARDLVPFIGSLANGFAALPKPIQMAVVGVGALVAAAGPAIWVFGQLATAAGTIAAAFTAKGIATRALTPLVTSLMTPMKALMGVFGSGTTVLTAVTRAFSLLTGPVGWFIGAASGILTATGTWDELWRILKAVGEIILNVVVGAFKLFVDWGGRFLGFAASLGKAVADFTGLSWALGKLGDMLSWLGGKFAAFMGWAADFTESVALVTSSVERMLPKVESPLKPLTAGLLSAADAEQLLVDQTKRMTKETTTASRALHKTGDEVDALEKRVTSLKDANAQLIIAAKAWAQFAGSDLSKLPLKVQEQYYGSLQAVIDQYGSLEAAGLGSLNAIHFALDQNVGSIRTMATELRSLVSTDFGALWASMGFEDLPSQRLTPQQIADQMRLQGAGAIAGQDLASTLQPWGAMGTPGGPMMSLPELPPLRATNVWADEIDQLADSFEQLANIADNTLGDVARQLGVMTKAIDMAGESGKKMYDSLNLGSKQGVDWAGLTTGAVGVVASMDAATSSTSKFQNVLGGAAAGAKAGAVFGPWGAAIGAGTGALIGWVRSLGAGRDAVKDFAKEMGGFDTLHMRLGALGDAGEQMWVKLTQGVGKNNQREAVAAINEVGRALDVFEGAIQRYGLSLADLQTPHARFSASVRTLTADYRALSAAGFGDATLAKGMAGPLNDLIAAAMETGQKLPAALQPLIHELIRAGGLTDEIAIKLLGLTPPDATPWRDMQEAADRVGLSVEDLGQKFEQAKLNETAKQIADDWQLLADNGANIGAVVNAMKDEVQALISEALELGLAIPESMRPLVEALFDAGELTDENGEKLKDLSDIEFVDPILSDFDLLIDKVDELIDALTRGLGPALSGLSGPDFSVPSPDGSGFSTDGSGSGYPHLASGGIVRRPTMAVIGESGPEAVIPLNQLSSSTGGMTVILEVDGRQLTRTLTPYLPGEVQRLRLA